MDSHHRTGTLWASRSSRKQVNSSINQLAGYAMWPLGFALGGLTADQISPATVFLGAGFVVVVLYGLALFTRSIRQVQ